MGSAGRSITTYGEFWMACTALSYVAGNLFDRIGMGGFRADPWVGAIMKAIPQAGFAAIFILLQLDRQQFKEERRPVKGEAVWYFLASGLVSVFLGQVSFLTAMRLGGVAIAVPSMQVWTMIAAILGVLWLKEQFRPQVFLGLLVAVAGLVTLSVGQNLGKPVSAQW
ncbi:MAG TPA: DMT family transporter, partial [Firmicutes bacterium]|nr:DMT family transporter [Bacillota bacterium]